MKNLANVLAVLLLVVALGMIVGCGCGTTTDQTAEEDMVGNPTTSETNNQSTVQEDMSPSGNSTTEINPIDGTPVNDGTGVLDGNDVMDNNGVNDGTGTVDGVIEGAGNAVGDVIEGTGNAVGDVMNGVGNAMEDVGNGVNRSLNNNKNNTRNVTR